VASIVGVNSETGDAVGTVTLSPAHTNAGTYDDPWSFTGSGNYNDIASTSLTNVIQRAPLTVTADNVSKVTEAALPTFTATYSGFVNGEGPGVVTGLVLSTTATASSPAGTYAITASGATAANYAITYVDGALTVVPYLLVGGDLLVGGTPGDDTFTFTPGATAGSFMVKVNNTTLGTLTIWAPAKR
jgi:hypothetical protein